MHVKLVKCSASSADKLSGNSRADAKGKFNINMVVSVRNPFIMIFAKVIYNLSAHVSGARGFGVLGF